MSRKRKYVTEYSQKARNAIHKRDEEICVFCAMGYCMPGPEDCTGELQIMHIVPRARMGMGIEQNGALGCVYHHQMMDNGNQGNRAEMLEILEERMRLFYPGWSRESVTYRKYPRRPENSAAGSRPFSGSGPAQDPGDGFSPIPDGVDDNIPI